MRIEVQMAEDLRHDFPSCASRHGLLHKVARYINEQSITPENLHVLWLINEVWLVRQHNRCQPTGLREGDQTAFSGDVARQLLDQLEKCGVMESGRKGHPLGLLDVVIEVLWVAKPRMIFCYPFPQRPGTSIRLSEQSWRRIH